MSQKLENNSSTSADISSIMKEYFTLIDNFFEECAGFKAEAFQGENVIADNRNALFSRAEKIRKVYDDYFPQITSFYARNHKSLYESGVKLAGLKSVIGGSSRFPMAAFDGIRKFALYTDTIYIPDPILPWIEIERKEEKFRHIQILQECFTLLKLKPLVNADLPYPAVVVFPSWEKRLELTDQDTQDGISALLLSFFSSYLGQRFENVTELFAYITKQKKCIL